MVGVSNLTSVFIDCNLLRFAAEFILKKEGRTGNLSVALVEKEEIRILNSKYRGKNCSTDVLSFSYPEDELIGEIVISPLDTCKQANRVEREVLRVLVHGVLHILGYDHINKEEKKNMDKKQEDYFSFLENKFFKR